MHKIRITTAVKLKIKLIVIPFPSFTLSYQKIKHMIRKFPKSYKFPSEMSKKDVIYTPFTKISIPMAMRMIPPRIEALPDIFVPNFFPK